MSKKINLNMTTVENRELRLGTIIGWDGKGTGMPSLRDTESA